MPDEVEEFPRTALFRPSRGVFEGGGCRGAAHVGAFEAAIRCGVRFSEVAGTSAGSVTAALIGAGASAEFLSEELLQLDFQRFLAPPEPMEIPSGRIGALAGRWPLRWLVKRYRPGRILLFGGAHSSAPIEPWLDGLLARLLPDCDRPIRFCDLVIPTSIVTTDLGAGAAKVWGTKETPNEPVALAVRCSCTIPGFFQPVRVGANRFVDGGLLSNLPAFVFAQKPTERSLGGRVLAFTLEETSNPPREWAIDTLAARIIDTVIGGATDLQTRVQPGVHVVKIPTLGVGSTDFGAMTEEVAGSLAASGRKSTINFIRNEGTQLQRELRAAQHVTDNDELYTEFVREAANPGKELIVADADTMWFWRLFPTVLAWRGAGASVRVLLTSAIGSDDQRAREHQRRGFITGLGAQIEVCEQLPMKGLLIRRVDDHRDAAFVLNDSKTPHSPFASTYVGNSHREVIRALHARLAGAFSNPAPEAGPVGLAEIDPQTLIERLKRGVWQYTAPAVTITLDTVKVADMLMINRRVRAFKLRQIEELARAYQEHSVPLFRAARVEAADGKEISVVTPPVLEKRGDKSVVLEGNSRVLFAFENGLEALDVLHVRGATAPLPGIPIHPKRVLLSGRRIPPEERIEGFTYEQFRSIEGAVRPVPGDE